MIGNVSNNQCMGFTGRWMPKPILESSLPKVKAEQLLGIKHANINYSDSELKALGLKNKIINLESELDIATNKDLINRLKNLISQERQKLDLVA